MDGTGDVIAKLQVLPLPNKKAVKPRFGAQGLVTTP